MRLGEKQELFARLLPRLLDQAHALGFTVRCGCLERSAIEQQRMIDAGASGIRDANRGAHVRRLAIDLHLFRGGLYCDRTEDHRALGEWWEAQHELCRWGGRFSRPDGNHYSVTHEGVS